MTESPAKRPMRPTYIWLGEPSEGLDVRLFRRSFSLDRPVRSATLRLYAEARYLAYINGTHLGRGPILHHPDRLPTDTHDLTRHLAEGPNVLAIGVLSFGCALHNHVPTGHPGLMGELRIDHDQGPPTVIRTDEQWRVTARTGWQGDAPRRGWAIGYVEVFDAAEHPQGWRDAGFDDAAWDRAETHDGPFPDDASTHVFPSPLPPLRYAWRSGQGVLSFKQVDAPPPPVRPDYRHGEYGELLSAQPWNEPTRVRLDEEPDERGGFTVAGLSPDHGAAIAIDLGAEYTGQIQLVGEAQTPGTIDLGWSEYLDDGRPRVLQKGTSYVDRIRVGQGAFDFTAMQYTAARYLAVTLRGFTGSLRVERLGMRTSEPDLDWSGRFESGDDAIDGVFKLAKRSQAVGTQEGLMDCPTREQAAYVGDGHPVSRWIALLTGDARHWKYLVTEQFQRQADNGLIRSTVFSGRNDTLIDYPLLGVIGTRDYLDYTGDTETVAPLLPACHRVLGWFDRQLDDRGLFAWAWPGPPTSHQWENRYDPTWPTFEGELNLFIDHPGMGWHNTGLAGIDRRGINAAINALLVMAREALADLEQAAGSPARATRLREQAQLLREASASAFFDADRGVFVDGELNGQRLEQVSEHTNTWAVAAGWCDAATARAAMTNVLDPSQTRVARGGPYFWYYIFPVLERLGMQTLGLERVRSLWGPMLAGGATTLWETFAGDEHDSACHPWSGAPLQFLLSGIAGLPDGAGLHDAASQREAPIVLRPRPDLLDRVDARVVTAAGPIEIAWRTDADRQVHYQGRLPDGLSAVLVTPFQSPDTPLTGTWETTLNAHALASS